MSDISFSQMVDFLDGQIWSVEEFIKVNSIGLNKRPIHWHQEQRHRLEMFKRMKNDYQRAADRIANKATEGTKIGVSPSVAASQFSGVDAPVSLHNQHKGY